MIEAKKDKINNLSNIDGTFKSYEQLIQLYQTNKELLFSTVHISLSHWFAANISAALGAILDKLQENFNTIEFVNIDQNKQ